MGVWQRPKLAQYAPQGYPAQGQYAAAPQGQYASPQRYPAGRQ